MTYPGNPTGYPAPQGYQQQPLPPLPYGVQPTQVPQAPGYYPPQQPVQPMYPQQPVQQPLQYIPQQPTGADLNQRLSGPGIPPELNGKTVAEAMRYYGIMRQDFVQRQTQQQQQPPVQQQQGFQPQQQQQQPQGQQQFQSAQPRTTQQQHPDIDPIRQAVAEALAPVVGPMQQQQLIQTYNNVKGRFQDWQQFEPEILGSMQGGDPNVLQNPAAWEAAYFHAKGKSMSQPQRGGPPLQGYGPPQGYQQPQGYGVQPQGYGPPTGYPTPQQQGYQPQNFGGFVEGPTPSAPGISPMQHDPRDDMGARRFGVPVEVYRTWKGGNIGLMPSNQPPSSVQPTQQHQQSMQQQFIPPGFQPQIPQVPSFAYPGMSGGR